MNSYKNKVGNNNAVTKNTHKNTPPEFPSGVFDFTPTGLIFKIPKTNSKIVLPLFEKDANLTEDEKVIYKLLSKTMLKPISEIAPYIPFGKSKTTKLLKDMSEKGVIAIEGKGRGTKYIIK